MLVDLARRVGSTGFVVGIDPDEDRISVAQTRFKDHTHANVEVYLGSNDESEASSVQTKSCTGFTGKNIRIS